jgi:hypothetical protein
LITNQIIDVTPRHNGHELFFTFAYREIPITAVAVKLNYLLALSAAEQQ